METAAAVTTDYATALALKRSDGKSGYFAACRRAAAALRGRAQGLNPLATFLDLGVEQAVTKAKPASGLAKRAATCVDRCLRVTHLPPGGLQGQSGHSDAVRARGRGVRLDCGAAGQ